VNALHERMADVMGRWPRGLRLSRARPCSWRFPSEIPDLFALPPLPRTLEAALRDVESKRSETRRSALVDLVRYSDTPERPAVVGVVGRMMQSDPDREVRAAATIAVADAELTELSAQLVVALEDPEPRVRQMALLALSEVGSNISRDTLERIRPLLQSPLPGLRYQALVAWCRLVRADGLVELVQALGDEDTEVRWVAWSLIEEQLDALSSKAAAGLVASSDNTFDRATTIDTAALLTKILPLASDATLRIRVVAAAVTLRLGDATAMASLLERIERSGGVDRDDLVALIERFGRHKYEPARRWLTRRARRGWFEGALGWPATVALAGLGDAAAEQAILQELASGSARRRERALAAIRDLRLVAAIDKVRWLEKHASGIDPWLIGETLSALGEPRAPQI
jgi:hypothetical protein